MVYNSHYVISLLSTPLYHPTIPIISSQSPTPDSLSPLFNPLSLCSSRLRDWKFHPTPVSCQLLCLIQGRTCRHCFCRPIIGGPFAPTPTIEYSMLRNSSPKRSSARGYYLIPDFCEPFLKLHKTMG